MLHLKNVKLKTKLWRSIVFNTETESRPIRFFNNGSCGDQGNCSKIPWKLSKKSSEIKLGLGVNKPFLLQLLGQKNCQTLWYLFYFGKMRLPISETKIFSDRRQQSGLILSQMTNSSLKPC